MKFLNLISILAVAIVFSTSVAAANPNIIYILADDQGYGDIACNTPFANLFVPLAQHMGVKIKKNGSSSKSTASDQCCNLIPRHHGTGSRATVDHYRIPG